MWQNIWQKHLKGGGKASFGLWLQKWPVHHGGGHWLQEWLRLWQPELERIHSHGGLPGSKGSRRESQSGYNLHIPTSSDLLPHIGLISWRFHSFQKCVQAQRDDLLGKVLAAKPDDTSLIPQNSHRERSDSLQIVLWPLYRVPWHMHRQEREGGQGKEQRREENATSWRSSFQNSLWGTWVSRGRVAPGWAVEQEFSGAKWCRRITAVS